MTATHTFIGVDLAWSEKNPSGLAVARGTRNAAQLTEVVRLAQSFEATAAWIEARSTTETVIVAIDAPLVVPNDTGMRNCERDLTAVFRAPWAGTHSSNRSTFATGGPPWLAAALESRGFRHAADLDRLTTPGRWMIEVYPHPAIVRLFGLERRLLYKKGTAEERSSGLVWLRGALAALTQAEPSLEGSLQAAALLTRIDGKALEDQLDAWLCVYIAQYACRWLGEHSRVFVDEATGYIFWDAFSVRGRAAPRAHCS